MMNRMVTIVNNMSAWSLSRADSLQPHGSVRRQSPLSMVLEMGV